MQSRIHRADSRGVAEHGWLHSRHTFSFAGYYDPERMGFGKLRVINDDVVEPGAGFGTHPHDNMEIISIPLSGGLRHRDSMGNEHIIQAGDIQVISAGTGITHYEFNASESEPVNFLQIWVYPRLKDIEPRYDQKTFETKERQNHFVVVVSPERDSHSVWINQDAWFSLGDFTQGQVASYAVKQAGHGVYILVLEGQIRVGNTVLSRRDAVAITDTDHIDMESMAQSSLLIIEVPH